MILVRREGGRPKGKCWISFVLCKECEWLREGRKYNTKHCKDIFFFYSGTVMMMFAHFSHSHVTNGVALTACDLHPQKTCQWARHIASIYQAQVQEWKKGNQQVQTMMEIFTLPRATVNGTTTTSTRANNNFLGNVPSSRWIYATATEETPMTHNKQPQRGGETEEMWMRK